MTFDTLFLGATSVDLNKGIFTTNEEEAAVERAMINSSRKIILVADHTKFEKSALIHFCTFDEITGIITDSKLPERLAKSCQEAGIEIFKS